MSTSNHGRSPLARLALAAGGIGVLIAAAAVLRYAAEAIGTVPAAVIAAWLLSCCGLAHSVRSHKVPGLTRPAPVRLPVPARDTPEPAGLPG